MLKYTTVAGVDGFDGRARSQKQWLRPLFNILNKKAKNIALILASVNVISSAVFLYLLNVMKGGGKTQRNLSNPLSYKEGATFYFMLNYLAFKIDNTRILPKYFSNLS
jgi:hypothetical protein